MNETVNKPLVAAIWESFLELPMWVRIWLMGILVPVNMASVFFVGQPNGPLISVLAVGGLAIGTALMLYERGFTRLLALGHIVSWTPLVLWLIFAMPDGSDGYGTYLWILLVADLISLAFDYPDLAKWMSSRN
jgi:hypothetical protein